MWELDCEESWVPKNWCFWTVVLEKTLESPLHCKEIQPVYPKGDQSWVFIGRLMLRLKLEYFGHLMRRADSLEKTLMLRGIGGRRGRGRQRMRRLDGITGLMDLNLSKLHELVLDRGPGMLWFMGSQRGGHDWATELDWTLTKVKEESEKTGLKLNVQKTKIMASGPITSWQIDGEKVETVTDFIFRGSNIPADGDCSHEIKRCLQLGRNLWPT